MPQAKPAKPFKWDEEKAIVEVQRSTSHVYRVGYARKGKREYITVRYWYYSEPDKAWKPTRNGANYDLEQVQDVVAAIIEAAMWANDHEPQR